jgi:hypothetical protein
MTPVVLEEDTYCHFKNPLIPSEKGVDAATVPPPSKPPRIRSSEVVVRKEITSLKAIVVTAAC